MPDRKGESDREWFAYLADKTQHLWKRHGYRVHVQTNARRVVITPAAADGKNRLQSD